MSDVAANLHGWKLLETSPDLLLAVREKAGGLLSDLRELQPAGAVLAGDLGEMQPSDLLNFLHQGRRTGVLLTRSHGVERGIVLLDGNVAWACSTSPGERLGERLYHLGLIQRGQLDGLLSEQSVLAPHKRLGQLLIDRGMLPPDQVWRVLREQVHEIFLGLLVARGGTFVFLRGIDRTKLPSVLSLDTQGLLLDGLRRLDEMEMFRTRLPSVDVRLARTEGKTPPEKDDGEHWTPESRNMLGLIDGQRTLSELSRESGLGEFDATRIAFRLLQGGYIRVAPGVA